MGATPPRMVGAALAWGAFLAVMGLLVWREWAEQKESAG